MKIRYATIEDCRAIAEAHVASWQGAYAGLLPSEYLASLSVDQREDMWKRILAGGVTRILCVEDAGSVVGFAAFGNARDEDSPARQAEVYAIYLLPSWWSRGAGRALWHAVSKAIVADGYTSIILWVIAANDRAIRFYAAAGFVADNGAAKQLEIDGAMFEEVRYVRTAG